MTPIPMEKHEKIFNRFCLNGKITLQHTYDILEILKEEIAKAKQEARDEAIDECRNLIGIHTEKKGEYCDTGEDMDWACRSDCIELAKIRLQSLKSNKL